MNANPEGWGWPGASRKAHYFVGIRSLCGGWMFSGELNEPDLAKDTILGRDDCRDCHKRLLKLKGKCSECGALLEGASYDHDPTCSQFPVARLRREP